MTIIVRIDGFVVITPIMTMIIQGLPNTIAAVVVIIILRVGRNRRTYNIQIEHLLEVVECMRLDLEEYDQIGYTH